MTAITELDMMPPLLQFLTSSGTLRPGATVAEELAWRGRRVDLTVMNNSKSTSAFELKLRSPGRVLEQAIYNSLSFDRSWIVIPAYPTSSVIAAAQSHGIGIIVVGEVVRRVAWPERNSVSGAVATRLKASITAKGYRVV